MSFHAACSWGVEIALAATIAGTFWRGRASEGWSFVAYLALILAGDLMVVGWREQFNQGWFWILKQSVWDIAKLAVAVELLARAVRTFPGAKLVARTYLVGALTVSSATLLLVPDGHQDAYGAFLVDWHPRVLTSTIWLMTGTALLIVWYRLPVSTFQKAILAGFVPYLVIFTTLLNILRTHGFQIMWLTNRADRVAYLAVCLWWAVHAWRRPAVRASEGASHLPPSACPC